MILDALLLIEACVLFSENKRAAFPKGAYSLGKVVWGKGWEELLRMLDYCKMVDGYCPATAIDCFGDGEARVSVSSISIWQISQI